MKPSPGSLQSDGARVPEELRAEDRQWREEVRDFFGARSSYLDMDLVLETRREAVSRLGLVVDGAEILDVGCGDGSMSLRWLEKAASLTLVDLTPEMLSAARANIPREHVQKVRLLEADFLTAEVGGPYDLVLCLGVLAHVPSSERAMHRLAVVVRAGGQLVIQLTDADRPLGRVNTFWGRRGSKESAYRVQRLSGSQLVEQALAMGLSLRRSLRYSLLMPGSGRLPARLTRGLELASLKHRWMGWAGAEQMVVFRKGEAG